MALNDYKIDLIIRCESKPETWIVDAMYDQLNKKINEDIIEWHVNPIEQTNTNPPTNKDQKDEHNDATS